MTVKAVSIAIPEVKAANPSEQNAREIIAAMQKITDESIAYKAEIEKEPRKIRKVELSSFLQGLVNQASEFFSDIDAQDKGKDGVDFRDVSKALAAGAGCGAAYGMAALGLEKPSWFGAIKARNARAWGNSTWNTAMKMNTNRVGQAVAGAFSAALVLAWDMANLILTTNDVSKTKAAIQGRAKNIIQEGTSTIISGRGEHNSPTDAPTHEAVLKAFALGCQIGAAYVIPFLFNKTSVPFKQAMQKN